MGASSRGGGSLAANSSVRLSLRRGWWPWHLLALVCCLSWNIAAAGGNSDGKHATLLTPATFDDYLERKRADERPALIMFHVDWCKVCQRTFPKFANASDMVFEKKIDMDFAHVDCTNDKTLCQRFEVKGYPSIKLFRPSVDPRNFKGQRTEESFVRYADRMTQPAVHEDIKTAEQLDELLKEELLASFVAVKPPTGELPASVVDAAETWMDRHIFAVAPSLADLLPKGIRVPAGANLAVLSPGKHQWPGSDNTSKAAPAVAFYRGPMGDSSAVGAWVERNRFPGIWKLDETNFYEFTHASRNTAMVAFDPSQVTRTQEVAVRDAAERLGEEFLFGVLDGVAWSEELRDFNLEKKDMPRVLVTEDNFETWIEDIEQLRLEHLEKDLHALLNGAPVLRQSRSVVAKMQFYGREAWRFAVFLMVYAGRGPLEAILVCAGSAAAFGLFLGAGWLVSRLVSALFDDSEPQHPHRD